MLLDQNRNIELSIELNVNYEHIIYLPLHYDSVNSLDIDMSFNDYIDIVDMYSYSEDGETWSEWIDSSDSFISQVNYLTNGIYIRVFLEPVVNDLYNSSTNIYQSKVSVLKRIFLNGLCVDVDTISITKRSDVTNYTKTVNMIDMNRHLDRSREVQEVYHLGQIDATGIKTTYFAVDPDLTKSSYTFKQHTLFNVTKRSNDVKVIFPSGTFKNLKKQYEEWGSVWGVDISVYVSSTRFKEAFSGRKPATNDIIYIEPINKLYSVKYQESDTVELGKTFKYKLTLTDYQIDNKINTTGYDELDDMYKHIDNVSVYTDDNNPNIELNKLNDELNAIIDDQDTRHNYFDKYYMELVNGLYVERKQDSIAGKYYTDVVDNCLLDSDGEAIFTSFYVVERDDILTYKLSNVNENIDTFNLTFWYERNNESQFKENIFRLRDNTGTIKMEMSTKKLKSLCQDSNNNQKTTSINIPELTKGIKYAISINYVRNSGIITLNIYDTSVNKLIVSELRHETFISNGFTTIELLSGHYYNNIRLIGESVLNDKLMAYLFDVNLNNFNGTVFLKDNSMFDYAITGGNNVEIN